MKHRKEDKKAPLHARTGSPTEFAGITQKVASPRHLSDHTKLSPLASFMQNKAFSSSLRDVKGRKGLLGDKKSAFKKQGEDQKDGTADSSEEEKVVGQVPKIEKNQPWIDPKVKDLLLSPEIHDEAVRETRKELVEEQKKLGTILVVCSCGSTIEQEGSTLCLNCKLAQVVESCSGYLYEKSESKKHELLRYWYVLVERHLFSKKIGLYC